MSRRLYDFKCDDCGETYEKFVDTEVREEVCKLCQGRAKRLISTPRIDPRLGIDSTSFPSLGDKWARVRAQRAKIERQQSLEHGTSGAISSAGSDVQG